MPGVKVGVKKANGAVVPVKPAITVQGPTGLPQVVAADAAAVEAAAAAATLAKPAAAAAAPKLVTAAVPAPQPAPKPAKQGEFPQVISTTPEEIVAAETTIGLEPWLVTELSDKKYKTTKWKIKQDITTVSDHNPEIKKEPYPRPFQTAWTIMRAYGDGHCMLHSFLTSVSPTYRKIPYELKGGFVQLFRYGEFLKKAKTTPHFLEVGGEDQSEKGKLAKKKKQAEIVARILDSDDEGGTTSKGWLQTDELIMLTQIFPINIFVISTGREGVPNFYIYPEGLFNADTHTLQDNGNPWIAMYNIFPAHYDAIRVDGKYIFPYTFIKPYAEKYISRFEEQATVRCFFAPGDQVWFAADDTDEYIEETLHRVVSLTWDESSPPKCKQLRVALESDIQEKKKGSDNIRLKDPFAKSGGDIILIDNVTVKGAVVNDQEFKLIQKWDSGDTVYYVKRLRTAESNEFVKKIEGEPGYQAPFTGPSAEVSAEENENAAALRQYEEARLGRAADLFSGNELLGRLHEQIVPNEEKKDPYTTAEPDVFIPTTRRAFSDFIETTFNDLRLPVQKEPDYEACAKMGVKGQQQAQIYKYQQFVREYMNMDSPYRGLLVYHGLGSGKTCSAIAASEALYAKYDKKIVVMTPFSLKKNFINELTFCGFRHYRLENHWIPLEKTTEVILFARIVLKLSKEYVDKVKKIWVPDFAKPSNFETLQPAILKDEIRNQIVASIQNSITFIHYNGITKKQLLKYAAMPPGERPFDNAVIVVDEIHNLVRLIQGQIESKLLPGKDGKPAKEVITPARWMPDESGEYSRGYLLYRLLLDSTNSKIIGLSGTPMINFPEELGILANILHKYTYIARASYKSSALDADEAFIRTVALKHPYIDDIRITRNQANLTVLVTGLPEGTKKLFDKQGNMKGVTREEEVTPFSDIVESFKKELAKERKFMEFELTAEPLLPPFADEFRAAFIKDGKINDDGTDVILGKRLTGLISYYKGSKKELMPEVARDTNVFVPMSEYLVKEYSKIRGEEIGREMKEEDKKKKGRGVQGALPVGLGPTWADAYAIQSLEQSTSYKMTSRQTCNFAFIEEVVRPRPIHMSKEDMKLEAKDVKDLIEPRDEDETRLGAIELPKVTEDEEEGQEADEEEKQEEEAAPAAAEPKNEDVEKMEGEVKEIKAKLEAAQKANPDVDPRTILTGPEIKLYNRYQCRLGFTGNYKEDCVRSKNCLLTYGKNIQKKGQAVVYGKLHRDGQLSKYSPKFANILANIESTHGSSLVYSQFLEMEGIGIFSIVMEINGFVEIKLENVNGLWQFSEKTAASLEKGPGVKEDRYIRFTGGEADEQRRMNLALFNGQYEKLPDSLRKNLTKWKDSKNLTGELCRVFCITSAGAEGISLRNVRAVHIMEPYWNDVRLAQVKGRAIRICSHFDLPLEERNVDIYTYIACFPKQMQIARQGPLKIEEQIQRKDNLKVKEAMAAKFPVDADFKEIYVTTSDEQLFYISQRKKELIDSLQSIMKDSAVDCVLNATENEINTKRCITLDGTVGDYMYHPILAEDLKTAREFKRGVMAPAAAAKAAYVPPETFNVRELPLADGTKKEVLLKPIKVDGKIKRFDLYEEADKGFTKRLGYTGVSAKGDKPAPPITWL